MNNFSEYSEMIVAAIVVALTAFGGSSGGIVIIIRWIKNAIQAAVNKLAEKSDAFKLKADDFNRVNNNLNEVVGVLGKVVERLESHDGKIDGLEEVLSVVCKCLVLIAKNNDRMIDNGSADEVIELVEGLAPAQVEEVKPNE